MGVIACADKILLVSGRYSLTQLFLYSIQVLSKVMSMKINKILATPVASSSVFSGNYYSTTSLSVRWGDRPDSIRRAMQRFGFCGHKKGHRRFYAEAEVAAVEDICRQRFEPRATIQTAPEFDLDAQARAAHTHLN